MAGHAQNLTEGNPAKLIIRLAVPVCIENTLWMVLTAAVSMIVGKGAGTEGLAAIGASAYAYNFFAWFSFGFSQVLSGIVGMYYGLGDRKRLYEGVRTAAALALITGVILAVAGLCIRSPLLALLGTPESILRETERYLTMQYIALIGATAHYVLSFIMIAFGNGLDPIIDIVILGGTAVIFTLIFVGIFHLGAISGSIATGIGYVLACLYDIHALRKMNMLVLPKGEPFISRVCIREMLLKALPFGLQLSISSVGGMLMQRALNLQGAGAVAAFAAVSSLCTIPQGIQNGIGYTMNSFVSQNYGAGQWERIRKGMLSALGIGVGLWAVIAAVQILGGRALLTLYVTADDPGAAAVVREAYRMLLIMSACSGGLQLLYICRSSLVGMGKASYATFGTVMEILGRGFTAVLFPTLMGLPGVYFAEPGAWVLCGLANAGAFAYSFRKMKGRSGA